jgi:hypothetical protein
MSLPRFRLAVLLAVSLAVSSSQPLAAQVSWTGHLGVTATSTMVTDQIIESIHLKPGIEPTLNLMASIPLQAKTPVSALAELQVTTGTLRRDDGSHKTDLASMRTTTILIGLAGHLAGPLHFRSGIGLISYATTEKASIFQEGTPTRFAAMGGIEYQYRLTSKYTLSALARYDFHTFMTRQLENNGYTGYQAVHRVMVGVGVSK